MNDTILLFYQSNNAEIKTKKMNTTQLTLTNGKTVEIITTISKNLFKVSYGKDTKGNDIVGIINRSMIISFI